MKLFKNLVVFGVGAAIGYLVATNHVEINLNTEPIVEKIKSKIDEIKNAKCCCKDDECCCGDDCCCEDEDDECCCGEPEEKTEETPETPDDEDEE